MKQRTCDHPDFGYCICRRTGRYPFVFIFERQKTKDPPADVIADYERRKHIVESNGGIMPQLTGIENPRFTRADMQKAIRAVQKANPDLVIMDTWNGAGLHALSIACKKKERSKDAQTN